MEWIYLIAAGLMESVYAVSLKYSQGFTRLWPSLIFMAAGATSFYLLSLALRALPVGTAYAVWTGVGAVSTALVGMVLLEESRGLSRLVSILLIVVGIVGLSLVERH